MNRSKKSRGLIRSIVISVIITIAAALVLLSVIGFAASYAKVNNGVRGEAEQSLSVYKEKIDGWLTEQAEFCASQANAAGNLVPAAGNRRFNDKFIDSAMTLNDALLDCYTAYKDKGLYMAVTDTSTLPEGFDATSRDWYKKSFDTNSTIITAPYIDTATGTMIVTVASPIYENGNPMGVFGCDITLDYIIDLVGEMQLTENGVPVLIDGDGNIMLHGNDALSPRLENGEAVITSVNDAGGDYGAVVSALSDGMYMDKNKYFDGTE